MKLHPPLVLAAFLTCALLPAPQSCAQPPTPALSQEQRDVLSFCQQNVRQQVGNGECAALANVALKNAGAKVRPGKDYPSAGDYVWGNLVCVIEGTPNGTRVASGSLKNIRPGDIAQFRDSQFPKSHFSHHTAVVIGVNDNKLAMYQQNFRGEKFVSSTSVRIDKLLGGWIRFYEPIQNAN